jgi:hypothetical protein
VTTDTSTNQDDLAFLRNLLEGDRGAEMRHKFGIVYVLCGVVWVPYVLLVWVQMTKLAPIAEVWTQRAWLMAMILFVGSMIWGLMPKQRVVSRTTSNRAFGAAFAGIGYMYLVLLAVLMYLSYERKNGIFALLYAVVVFAGQGAAWYVAWVLQRQAWFGVVAIGWYVAALITGLNVLNLPNFLLCAAVSMILLMALPGFILIQRSRAASVTGS